MRALCVNGGLYSRWDRYLGMTAPMTQVPVPTAIHDVSIIIAPQKVRVAASTHWVILVFIIVLFDILEHLHKF